MQGEQDIKKGHLHPITEVTRRIAAIFDELGFEVAEGPEIETEFYNFDALNIPSDHPARDMQDTFLLKNRKEILRTQTSAIQIRYMEKHQPPFKVIVPGERVFRREATDATHDAQFYQTEALFIDKNITMADLKSALLYFLQKFFGQEVSIRLRPSYFPFVEPGAEVDVSCFKCAGKGCSVCKHTGWIEIMGAGMVHPFVLKSCGIDPNKWQGYAFAIGVDRVAMLKYGIDDIRLLYTGDLRIVNQF
jgi:phenylalanyl-tRNA synthetase alpha chain